MTYIMLVVTTVWNYIVSNSTAILSFMSAAAAVVSAWMSYRSARDAKNAAAHAQGSEKKLLVREMIREKSNIEAEYTRIANLSLSLKRAVQTLGVFTGNTNSARLKMRIDKVEEEISHATEVKDKALKDVSGTVDINSLSESEMNNIHLIRIEAVIELALIREMIEKDIESVEEQNSEHRRRSRESRPRGS